MCLSKSNFYSSLKKQIVKSENNEEADHITFIAVKKKFMKFLINLKLLLKYVIGINFCNLPCHNPVYDIFSMKQQKQEKQSQSSIY